MIIYIINRKMETYIHYKKRKYLPI